MITIHKIYEINLNNAHNNGLKIEYIIRHGIGLIFADPNLGDIAQQMIGLDFDSELQNINCDLDPITHQMLDYLSKQYESSYTEIVNVACYIFNAILQEEKVDIGRYNLTDRVDQYLEHRRSMKRLL